MWSSTADIHLKLLDRAVSDAWFLTGGVFECDIAHRRSAHTALRMLYKIRYNPMHPLNGALPGPNVPVPVTRGAQGRSYRYAYASPRCKTSQCHRTFIHLSVSLWNDLADPVFDGVELGGFKSRDNAFYSLKLLYPYYSLLLLFFIFSSFCLLVGVVGLGSSD